MLITEAQPQHLPEIAALVNSAYRSGEGWTHEADIIDGSRTSREDLERELAGPDPAVILCLRTGETARIDAPIQACVLLRRKTDRLYLGMLSVNPAAMAQGLGRTLLEASEAYAREHRIRRIEMSVINVRETLIAWYERRGYRRTGQSIPFPYENKNLGKPHFPDLAFEILEKYL